MSRRTALLSLLQDYMETDPVRAARHLEGVSEDAAVEVLKSLPPAVAAEATRHANDQFIAAWIAQLPPDTVNVILKKLRSEQVAAVFLNLPQDVRENLLGQLDEKMKKEIADLLAYPAESAGRIMSTHYLAFHADMKVKSAVQKLRETARRGEALSYLYVVDANHKLLGVMNMRDMLLAPPEAALESVMKSDVFAIDCFSDREKIAAELAARKYFAAPVVDSEKRLLGVVKVEKLLEGVQEEATEDLQKMFGAGGDERAFSPVRFSLRKRLPWLYVNLATAFLAAAVVSLFQDIIAKITLLAIYLPVVAGQGGNAGAQSLAVVMRGLVMREIRPEKAKKLILKETGVGVINGVVIGVVTSAIAWLWHGNPYLGVVIGLGMVVNLTVAGLSGAAIPLAMKAVGIDPAQSSSIILTTITDVMGFFAFLGFAVLFQNRLL